MELLNIELLFYIICVMTFAGFIKGVVGFAFPMISYSFLSLIFSAEHTLSILIFPTIVMNIVQLYLSKKSYKKFKLKKILLFLIILLLTLFLTTQIYFFLPVNFITYSMAFFIMTYSLFPNMNLFIKNKETFQKLLKFIIGIISGFFGGVSGIWGPSTVIFLLSINVTKKEFIFFQSIIFILGSIFLIIGHSISGLINFQSAINSIFFIIPSLLGLIIGTHIRTKINTSLFFFLVRIVLFLCSITIIVNTFSS